MKRILLLIVLALLLMAPSRPVQQRSTQHRTDDQIVVKPDFTDAHNPASMYCVEQGFNLVIREDEDGNQYGVCKSGNKECGEWDFYNGLCFLEPKCPRIIQ